jgi:hypothetical protein
MSRQRYKSNFDLPTKSPGELEVASRLRELLPFQLSASSIRQKTNQQAAATHPDVSMSCRRWKFLTTTSSFWQKTIQRLNNSTNKPAAGKGA